MNRKWLTAGVAGVLVLGFAGYALYRAGVSAGHSQAVSGQGAAQKPGDQSAELSIIVDKQDGIHRSEPL